MGAVISNPPADSSSYAPGSFTVATGTFKVMADELVLAGTDLVAIEGTGTLVII